MCEICDGSGKIRLPVKKKDVLSYDNLPSLEVREYPCPECNSTLSYDNIQILSAQEVIPSEDDVPDIYEYVTSSIGVNIGKTLAEDGYIQFTKRIEKDTFSFYDKC